MTQFFSYNLCSNPKDTIFALSTAMGKAGVAVIRISGPIAFQALTHFGFIKDEKDVKQRYLYNTKLVSPINQEIIDDVLISYFQAPYSFTGQNIVEIHCHGSIAVIHDILNELGSLDHFRPAEPGEFTQIAFVNGKMDLTKVEALADLLQAETSIQRKIAIHHLSGQLQKLYDDWRHQLIQIMAQIEAYIDFPEDDIPEQALNNVQKGTKKIANGITHHLQVSQHSQVITNGIHIAIIGKPNVGKSTLINLLSQEDIAIVSHEAGTTRDILQAHLQIKGYSVILYDTAGIRETNNAIEMEGVKKAKYIGNNAEIVLHMFDLSEIKNNEIVKDSNKTDDIANHANFLEKIFLYIIDNFNILENINSNTRIIVLNKIDLLSLNEQNFLYKNIDILQENLNYFIENNYNKEENNVHISKYNNKILLLSGKKSTNLLQFLDHISYIITSKYRISDEPIVTKIRQKQRLKQCLEILNSFDISSKHLELSAQDLRFAAHHLEIITGKIELDEVLNEIFSTFCIGK